MRELGKTIWVFSDGFYPFKSTGAKSHECISVLNTGNADAQLKLTLFFQQDLPPMVFSAVCPAMRSNHVRLDKLKNDGGEEIPYETCYSMVLESDVKVVAQYSRLDTSQGGMALCTTMGYCED